jgi:hypothetical protein
VETGHSESEVVVGQLLLRGGVGAEAKESPLLKNVQDNAWHREL